MYTTVIRACIIDLTDAPTLTDIVYDRFVKRSWRSIAFHFYCTWQHFMTYNGHVKLGCTSYCMVRHRHGIMARTYTPFIPLASVTFSRTDIYAAASQHCLYPEDSSTNKAWMLKWRLTSLPHWFGRCSSLLHSSQGGIWLYWESRLRQQQQQQLLFAWWAFTA